MVRRRSFVELYMGPLRRSGDPAVRCSRYVKLCKAYGYRYCVATVELRPGESSLELIDAVRGVKGVYAVRADIIASSTGEVLRILRRVRHRVELVSVRGITRQLIALASRDRRVDIVTLIPGSSPPLYRGDISYMASKGGILELGIGFLDISSKAILSRQLAGARRIVKRIGSRVDVALTVAGSEDYSPRDPRDLVEMGAVFFGINRDALRRALSEVALSVIEKNRLKISGRIPVEGVYIEESEEEVPSGEEARR